MKRIFAVLAVATLMVAMMVATAAPAFANPSSEKDRCDKFSEGLIIDCRGGFGGGGGGSGGGQGDRFTYDLSNDASSFSGGGGFGGRGQDSGGGGNKCSTTFGVQDCAHD